MRVEFKKNRHWPKKMWKYIPLYFPKKPRLLARIKFNETCLYDGSKLNGNQWNKLTGFYTDPPFGDACFIAWRPLEFVSMIEIATFINYNGVSEDLSWVAYEFGLVNINSEYVFKLWADSNMIRTSGNVMQTPIENHKQTHHSFPIDKPIFKTPFLMSYFGGSEKTPQPMHYDLNVSTF